MSSIPDLAHQVENEQILSIFDRLYWKNIIIIYDITIYVAIIILKSGRKLVGMFIFTWDCEFILITAPQKQIPTSDIMTEQSHLWAKPVSEAWISMALSLERIRL